MGDFALEGNKKVETGSIHILAGSRMSHRKSPEDSPATSQAQEDVTIRYKYVMQSLVDNLVIRYVWDG